MLIINPGSEPVDTDGQGWTNTYAGACAIAEDWLTKMRDAGIGHDVELVLPAPADTIDPPAPDSEGRWRFQYRHTVTDGTVELKTHGIDNLDAWAEGRILGSMGPRVYWKGSSSADPQLDDWAADGYVQTYRPADDRPPAPVVPTYQWTDADGRPIVTGATVTVPPPGHDQRTTSDDDVATVVGLAAGHQVTVRDAADGTERRLPATACTVIRADPSGCPDGGRCHHLCGRTECFRVRTCGPLSGTYPDDEWPDVIVRAFGG